MGRQLFAASVCDWAARVGIKGTLLARTLGVNRRTLYRWRKGLSAPTRKSVRALPKKFPKKQRTKLRRVFQEFLDARNIYLKPSITAPEAGLAMLEEWREYAECRMVVNRERVQIEIPINKQLEIVCDILQDTPKQFWLYVYVMGNPHLKLAGGFSARTIRTVGRLLKNLLRKDRKAQLAEKPVTPTNYEKPFSKLTKTPK